MLIQLLFFLFLIATLFFLTQKIQTHIYNSIYIVTKNKNFAIGVLIVLLLPGTIIHEISHFLIATILRVPTGELTVMPTIEKDQVKAGKLFLGQTDPFRLSLIGIAPILIGLFLIYAIGKLLIPNFFQLQTSSQQLITIIYFYLLFVISLTMFSSKKDLQGFIIAAPIILVLIVTLYLVGLRVFLENIILQKIEQFLTDLNYYLVIAIALDFLVFLVLNVNLSFWQKILKRRLN